MKYNDKGIALEEFNSNGELVRRNEDDINADIAEFDRNLKIFKLKGAMDFNIVNKIFEITGASTKESAQAFVSSYEIKKNNPAEYINDGLVVHYAIGNYSIGDALDTEEKIREYYNKLLIIMDKFRDAEIATYIAGKNNI